MLWKVSTMSLVAFLLIAIGAPLVILHVNAQENMSFYPSADATVTLTGSDTSGTKPLLACSHRIGDGGEEFDNFFLRFDISQIPSQASVQTATLSLVQTQGEGENITLSIYKVTSSWDESTLSGTKMPSFDASMTYGVLVVDDASGVKTFVQDFSELVVQWLQSPSQNYGLYFRAESAKAYIHEFGSRESGSSPTLSITYTLPDEDTPVISDVEAINITQTSADITWKTDEEATSFVDLGETSAYGMIWGSDDLSESHAVTVSSLAPATTYYFRVRSEDKDGNEAQSNGFTFTTKGQTTEEGTQQQPQIPHSPTEEVDENSISPPQNLKVSSKKDNETYYVLLGWDHSKEENLDGYRVYRSKEDALSYKLLVQLDANTLSYKDEDVEEERTYFYTVRAVKGGEESPDSNEEVITIYANGVGMQHESFGFWKGFVLLNAIMLPLFGVWYLISKKKGKLFGRKKNVGKRWKKRK